ncbi:LOW QUALITY PROTEIN: hypothetical protein U9M48_036955 [Paspalum notatum var. saurae]|uniref:Reverse transcriptase Ty1/copia-type domain-containing protein n=1 Tax=Paspalum notatum var. saurae TaxID=547442 RepID=A0AAQ3X9G4_PASNO
MSAVFWGEAVVTAVYILNHSPTKALNGMTPYEAWHGCKPAVSQLRVFSCLAFIKELSHIGKLDDRSTPRVFIGYVEGSKAYRILDPGTQRVRMARDVGSTKGEDGHGTSGWATARLRCTTSLLSTSTSRELGEQLLFTKHAYPSPQASTDSSVTLSRHDFGCNEFFTNTTTAGDSTHSSTEGHSSGYVHFDTSSCRPRPVEFATPLSHDEERLDAYHDSEPLQYRTLENLLGKQPVSGLVPRDLKAQLHLAWDDGETRSFAEAQRHAACVPRCRRRWTRLRRIAPGSLLISLVVFKLKRDEDGAIVKRKACLEGIDFDDAFAPVARMESVRLFALATQEGWHVHHMDVKSVFLNGELKEDLRSPARRARCCAYKKALYGLRQAPRAWNAKLDSTLKGMGFEQSPHETAIYLRGNGGNAMLVGVYVNDLVITGAKNAKVAAFKEEIKATFQMSDLGPLSFYLGIEVH